MQEKDTTNNDVTEESLGTVEEEVESTGAGEEVSTEVSTEVLDITPSTILEGEKWGGQQSGEKKEGAAHDNLVVDKKYNRKSVALLFVIILIMCGWFVFSKNTKIKVTLLNANTKQPISNVTVQILSQNGINCIMAPCPTDEQVWEGRSSSQGEVVFPSRMINYKTYIIVDGYESNDKLSSYEERINFRNRAIDLKPN